MRIHHGTLGALLAASLTVSATGCGGTQSESGAGAAFMNGADEAEFQSGLAAQQAGDATEAERRFKRALAANPNFLSARVSLGNLQLQQNRNEEAVATFDAAVATRSVSVDGLLGGAEARLRLKQTEAALAASKRVIDELSAVTTPMQRSLAFTLLGRAMLALGQPDPGAIFQKAILANGSNTEARLALAELYMQTGTATDVVTALARAEEYERKPGYLLRIGRMMTAVHQPRRAVAVLMRAQQAAQTDDEIAIALGEAQLAVGDSNLALQTLTEVVSRSPARLDAQVLMGRAELIADRTDPALRRATAVLEASPEHAGGLYLIALLQLGHDDKVSAMQSLRRALASEPGDVAARTKLAELLAEREDWPAVADLLGEDAERAWAPSAWGDLVLQANLAGGRFDMVLPLLSRRANERNNDPDAHAQVVELALAHEGILEPKAVVAHARAAFDRSGGSLLRYRLVLIDALAAADQVKEALTVVEAGLKATPGNRELLQRRQALRR